MLVKKMTMDGVMAGWRKVITEDVRAKRSIQGLWTVMLVMTTVVMLEGGRAGKGGRKT